MCNVRFSYPVGSGLGNPPEQAPDAGFEFPARDVIRGVSLTIEPGERVALVGASGSGKTSLASLIPRLYDVSSGAVLIDGHDVRMLSRRSLRAAIGVVSQESYLFQDTIEANLRFAKPSATTSELDRACSRAQILDVIRRMPRGYDTVVGQRGSELSGGERQRLSIARVLLRDPAVVILDEATSHLDNENDAQVQEALDEALRGRTSLVIAHRLSTIYGLDRILVLSDGCIIEEGTHADLVALGGAYARMSEEA
ncbi:MAG: ATP-binding cassette domain-containing protein [Ilumatobacteraceae bacterium]